MTTNRASAQVGEKTTRMLLPASSSFMSVQCQSSEIIKRI